MKVQVASDLHLEFSARRFPGQTGLYPSGDVLVLAGDIHSGTSALPTFSGWPVPVIYVGGNHELYGYDHPTLFAELTRLTDEKAVVHWIEHGQLRCGAPRIRFLEKKAIILGETRFLGCALWTDYCLFGAHHRQAAMGVARSKLNDHRLIQAGGRPFTPQDAAAIFDESVAWLKEQLAQPFNGATVVVTHHAPHRNSLAPQYANDPLSAAFVSDLDDLITTYQPALWIHGHTHTSFDYMVGATRVLANPRGYPLPGEASALELMRFENPRFQPVLTVDV